MNTCRCSFSKSSTQIAIYQLFYAIDTGLFLSGRSMASIAEVEASYYKAIQAAKLSESKESPVFLRPYLTHAFKQWVKKLNIYDLDKDKADFYLDEAIVTKFEDYRRKIAVELAKRVEYDSIKLKGQTKNIGSCHDGSKIGKMNEVDSLYVLDENNITVENTDGIFRVILKEASRNCEILPRDLRNQFASTYADVVSNIPLPDCLKHAGYRSPEYSGLRYNGPAATSQFIAEDKDQRLLTWDMTPVLCLGREYEIYNGVRQILQPILKVNPDKMFGETTVHLIPDANEGMWRLSTAQLEADILRELIPSVAPMKTALSYSKAIASRLKKWNSTHLTCMLELAYCGSNIVNELDSYLKCPQKELGDRLNRMLRYAHIWIPPEKRKKYNEDDKPHVSINTAAIKHILLAAALEQPEAFSAKENDDLVLQLVQLVFKTLGNPSEFSSPHAFLNGVRIPHLSILSSQAENKMALALGIKH